MCVQTLERKCRSCTMVIISHDRHFLSSVCTHMADVDYGGIKVYPGNYDDYMEASTLAKQQQQNANARAKDRITDLEEFVRRFRAHKAKARQATSRMKQIEKLKVEDLKPSSRQYPFIRFAVDPKEKLHRVALEAKGLAKGYERGRNLFEKVPRSGGGCCCPLRRACARRGARCRRRAASCPRKCKPGSRRMSAISPRTAAGRERL